MTISDASSIGSWFRFRGDIIALVCSGTVNLLSGPSGPRPGAPRNPPDVTLD